MLIHCLSLGNYHPMMSIFYHFSYKITGYGLDPPNDPPTLPMVNILKSPPGSPDLSFQIHARICAGFIRKSIVNPSKRVEMLIHCFSLWTYHPLIPIFYRFSYKIGTQVYSNTALTTVFKTLLLLMMNVYVINLVQWMEPCSKNENFSKPLSYQW